jgi:autotransporter-associated beta strand protein
MFSFCRRHLPFALFPLMGSPLLAADLVWTAANPANTVWTAAGVWNGPATWVNGDSASFTASATVNLGSAISQTGVTIAAGSLLTLNNTSDIKITGAGGFSGDVIKTGSTTLRLSHSGGFNGTLTVGNQFVVLGSAATDPTGQTSNQTKVVINTGAGLILGSAYNLGTATIGELSGAGIVRTDWADGGTNGNRTLKVDQSTNSVFSGTFTQGTSNRTIGLEKSGTGTLDLSNNAALTVPQGGITVSGGILKISGNTGGGSPLNATGNLSIAGGATFQAANTTSGIPAGITKTITGSGTFLRNGSGNIVISGTSNSGFTGTWEATSGTIGFLSETSMGGSTDISLDGGGLFLNANGAGISSSKTITLGTGGGNFDGATGWTQTWSAKITGSGGFNKRSGMVLVLDGISNDYTGATNIQSGTLKLGAANAVATSSQIIVGASTTLDVSAVAWTLGASQILSGTGTVLGNAAIDGTLATGASAGTMTITGDLGLGSGSDWEVEIGGTATSAFDRLLVSGELTAGGTISLALINGFNPSVSNSFQIATFTSFVDNSYTFDFSGASLAPGLSWDISGFASSGVIAVVPEPGFAFLGSIGFLLILRRRR